MKTKKYITSDFYLACFLHSKGFELCDVQPTADNPKRMNFAFITGKCGNFADAEKLFFNGGLISVKKYVHSIRDLKGRLYRK